MFSVAQRSFAAFRAAHLLLIRRRSEQVSGVHFILTVNYCKCDNTFSCKCRHVDNGKIDLLTGVTGNLIARKYYRCVHIS